MARLLKAAGDRTRRARPAARRARSLAPSLLLTLLALPELLAVAAGPADAAMNDLDATIDVRAIASDGERSYLDGGLGLLRYDENHQGLRIGELRLGYLGQFADIVHITVEAVSYADGDRLPLDLTEAFIEIRPFPHNGWRSNVKIGAFYAPISLENRLQGWRSAYSLTPSAINTWIGEELRTIGAEYDLDWLGRQRGHDWGFGLGAAAFGWNESAGTLLAERGWALDDRQTTLFGYAANLGVGPVYRPRPFYWDIDRRAGYYVDGNAKYLDDLELRALHYDNRADPDVYEPALNDYAWHTWFDSAGARWTPAPDWTVISQWLAGDTCVAGLLFCWQYGSEFLLTSWQHGPNLLSARYDDFQTHADHPAFIASVEQRGHAWTAAYERELGHSLSVLLEALQVDSTLQNRLQLGERPGAVERMVQLAVRWDVDIYQ
jgi:hypothetical protein